jgi:ABC-type nitrate/sulfonate/bicarbonate transport system ATPase subunit
LEPFNGTYKAVFHGRDDAIRAVLSRLRSRRCAGSALLLLLGSSGCGKSSLVRAGLVPQLMATGAI